MYSCTPSCKGNLEHYLRESRGFKYVLLTLSSLERFALSGMLLANGSR